ncbi:MAG: phosphoribosylamine--glycine ligase [Gammaproteobacteria bacterium]|nr:phosphoribosylamine--glycine ligase [Gammaproteobacteria bacterium]
MKILIIGSGGREHALAWKVAQSPRVDTVFVAPGNAGTALEHKVSNVDISADDLDALESFAVDNRIDLCIVGPEAPLVAGVVDRFQARGLTIFGPTAAAARLEASKSYTKDFLQRHAIPTARYGVFTDVATAADFIESTGAPIVIKADGLAAGKGVVVAHTTREAMSAVHDMLAGNAFGEAGHKVVIEEFLRGEEASFIAMVDGENLIPFASSQDHKAAGDGDTGPNTGGMGAYSPAPVVTDAMHQHIMQKIMVPTIRGMAEEGHPFTGFLYAGLMIQNNEAKVIEFNVRLGDPETQPLLMRLNSDLVELCLSAVNGELDQVQPEWSQQHALGVVMAAGGYPGSYAKGHEISGLPDNQAGADAMTKVFHAGTRLEDQHIVTAGGRVLCVTALAGSVSDAQLAAYRGVDSISWKDVQFRRDIGYRAIQREQTVNENAEA